MLRLFRSPAFIGLLAALSATPVLARDANFGQVTLSPGFPRGAGMVAGNTGGSYSLPSLVNRDRNNTPCLGYGDETPDHIMVLQDDFSQLNIRVDSGGKDTTLVIKGPDNFALCGDDTGSSKDASVEASNLKPGEYSIWVGSLEPNKNWQYTLRVQE
ncbi:MULTISPECIES: hypothetical protein [unclassified Coleofasciculus]|uniref:hypothetical protein n=1 Tax=unclassified Coleofasciculus TaxID=2692782 RepID=UPI00187E14BC|nr:MULTISPECIES: hypothetical protein [unclassified Coleofasciculus]MBE9124663.1 hypothetical protein [Coleofasciculus sp. LEGE 07081]MBE9146990.1 hypothetical protein [Coleofasciculus sp. LEGE 07092]